MDILAVIAAITNLVTEVIKSQPPDVAADLWRLHLKDVQEFRKFFENVLPKPSGRLTVTSQRSDETFPTDIPIPLFGQLPKRTRKAKKR